MRPWSSSVHLIHPFYQYCQVPNLIHQKIVTSIYADDTQLLLSFSALNFSHNKLTLKTLYLPYPTGCPPTSIPLILLKLSFSYLVYYNNQQLSKLNNPTIHLPNNFAYSYLLILLAILVSSFI